jgi:enoyl-CoA hydratase/carnithine racemase
MSLLAEFGPVTRLTLNRPDKLNALNPTLLRDLIEAQQQIRDRSDVRVVLLRGAGRVFCAGADLEYITSIYTDPVASRENLHLLRDAIVGLEQLPVPVIAAVHGVALAGGLELLLGCDLIVAAESARIGDQHMNFGFIPGGGSTQRLPRWIGPARARDLLFTGRWVTAREGWELGLVSRVVPDVTLAEETEALAADLATRHPMAMAATKALSRRASDAGSAEGLQAEIEEVLAYYRTPEFAAALRQFAQRKGKS